MRLSTAATTRSHRGAWNRNAEAAAPPIRDATAPRSIARARCNRVFTASSPSSRASPGFAGTEALDVAQHEDRPIGVRQSIHGFFEQPLQLARIGQVFGCRLRRSRGRGFVSGCGRGLMHPLAPPDFGAILALSPTLSEALKTEFKTWGPGKYDPRHHAFDGTNLIASEQPIAADRHPVHLRTEGRHVETFTADGPIRTGTATSPSDDGWPMAASAIDESACRLRRRRIWSRRSWAPCSTTSSGSVHPSRRPTASTGAPRSVGRRLFRARCCLRQLLMSHVATSLDVRGCVQGAGEAGVLHDPAEVGMDQRYAERSTTWKRYRNSDRRASA